MEMDWSLHASKGGKKAKKEHVPSESGRVQATFKTGPKNQLRWHDGYIFEAKPSDASWDYRIFFPIDSEDEWIHGSELPVNSMCFRKLHLPNTKASEEELRTAKAAMGE